MSNRESGRFTPQTKGQLLASAAERLMSRTVVNEKTECWEWTGQRWGRGYGTLSVMGRHRSAHRFSYEIHNGPIADGMLVCHHCDNPVCVNPKHLFLGTHAENAADRNAKGRQARHKLTEADVIAIRAANGTQREVAAKFGVSKALISMIRAGKSWGWVAA